MKKLLVLFSTLFLINSCSSIKTIHKDKKSESIINKVTQDQVDLDINDKPLGTVEKIIEIKPQEETVRIGNRGGDVYQNNLLLIDSNQEVNRKLKIGLSLGPGIYRSINYVSLLKVFERQGLAPEIITGTGFGAIVAAMYAVGMTPEVIEWSFYKYFKEKKNNVPFEKEWINEIDKMFLSKFSNINIQNTKKKFFITLYNHSTQKTYYFDKGNIRDLLLLNLKLSNNLIKSNQQYTTAFENEVFNAGLLNRLGADFTIAIDSLGTKFDFDKKNESLLEIYKKVANRMQKEKQKFDYTLTLPLNLMNLDSTKNSPLFMQKTYDYVQKQSFVILKKMQEKAETLSHSGIEQ